MSHESLGASEYFRAVVLRQMTLLQSRDASIVAVAVAPIVTRDAKDGNDLAELKLRDAQHEGFRRMVAAVIKHDDSSTFTIAATGQIIKTPTVITVPNRDKKGKPLRSSTYPLFFEVSWQEFEEFVGRYLANVDRQMARYTTLEGVLRLREKYPQTRTPGEACALEGIDPRSIEIPEDWTA